MNDYGAKECEVCGNSYISTPYGIIGAGGKCGDGDCKHHRQTITYAEARAARVVSNDNRYRRCLVDSPWSGRKLQAWLVSEGEDYFEVTMAGPLCDTQRERKANVTFDDNIALATPTASEQSLMTYETRK